MGHFWPILGHLGPFMVTFWPSRVILDLDVALGHSRRVFFFFFVANIAFTRFFCRECRDYVLFGVEFWQKFWQKFLEILRILAEILRKKLATGVSDLKRLCLICSLTISQCLVLFFFNNFLFCRNGIYLDKFHWCEYKGQPFVWPPDKTSSWFV